MPGKMPRPSGAWHRPNLTRWCPGRCVMSSPLKVIDPRATVRSPEIVFSRVVLPAPFAPINDTISPSCTSIEMPLSAAILP